MLLAVAAVTVAAHNSNALALDSLLSNRHSGGANFPTVLATTADKTRVRT